MRLLCALELIALLFAQRSITKASYNLNPRISEASTNTSNSSKLIPQSNVFIPRGQHNTDINARQSACPDPSTDSLCASGFCFLVQDNGASEWGTCCLAGWFLMLNHPEWSTQKCCQSGLSVDQCSSEGPSRPPLTPVDCGSGGTKSGWACVYGSQNGARRAVILNMMVFTFGLAWLTYWICG